MRWTCWPMLSHKTEKSGIKVGKMIKRTVNDVINLLFLLIFFCELKGSELRKVGQMNRMGTIK